MSKKNKKNKKTKNKSAFNSIVFFIPKLIFRLISFIVTSIKFSMSFKIIMSYVFVFSLIVVTIAFSTSSVYFFEKANDIVFENIEEDLGLIEKNIFDKGELKQIAESNNIEVSICNLNDEYLNTSEYVCKYRYDWYSFFKSIWNDKKYRCDEETMIENVNFKINIYYDVNSIYLTAVKMFQVALIAGAIVLCLFLPFFIKSSRNLIRPIKNITRTTKKITVSNMNQRLDINQSQFELEELSKTINQMLDGIEEGYKSQQMFVSDASHELRTPIAVIKGYADMLNRWGKNDKAVLDESVDAIRNEADNMQDLVEKLLFIARSDKDTLAINKELFSVKELLLELEKEYDLIENKHIVSFVILKEAKLYADRNRIKQATRIFIENAIKYTPENGEIIVSGDFSEGYYNVSVKDNGIGIAKNDLGKIFDRLYRAEESRDRNIGGHGLGLSIARIIMRRHGGRIKVKSKLGKGTEFTLQMPLNKS